MKFNKRWSRIGRWLGVLAIVAGSGTWARAELTVQDLTGTAMPSGGPFLQDVTDALRAFSARDYKTAMARLQNARKVSPALPPAELMMARLYFDAGVPRGGNAMLESAIKSQPQDPEAFLLLAERALAENRLSEAELIYANTEKLVESYNQNPRRRQDLRLRAYTVGATVNQARGDVDAAKAKLASLIQLDPQNAQAHEQLGRLLFSQNDARGAYEEFKLAAQADESALPAELKMASLYPDKLTAKKWLDHAVKVGSEDVRTRVGAANFLLGTNQIAQAKAHAAKAIELAPDSLDSNLVAGLVARMEGDFATAVKHLSTAHLLQPTNLAVMNHLALVLSELPDEASQLRALQFAELVSRQNPESSDYLATLAWINYRLDRKAVAERYFTAVLNSRQVQSTMSLSSEIGYYLANLANDQGNSKEAIKLLQNSLNTGQPFAYRKAAQQLLDQLTASAGGAAEPDATSNATGPLAQ